MFDVKSAREEAKKIHAEATAHVEKYSAADSKPNDEEAKAQEFRFARIEQLAKQIEDADKLARFSFSKEQPVAAKAVAPTKSPDHIAYERETPSVRNESREAYAAQLTRFAQTGEVDDAYATITTAANTALVPLQVAKPIVPTKTNPFRLATLALGFAVESFGSTSPVNIPVISPTSGAAIVENNTSNTDGSPSLANIALTPVGYQSGTYWFSNLLINGLTYDVTATTLPALQAARDYGFAKAVITKIKADITGSNITQTTTTASTTTVSLANLDSLNQAVNIPYDNNKAIILNQDAYNLFEKLQDSQGRPIMQAQDIQGLHFLTFKGTPIFKTDALDLMGTSGHVVGLVVSMTGFRIRDEQEKLIRYVDNPSWVDQTGLNNVGYHAAGYVYAAVGALVN